MMKKLIALLFTGSVLISSCTNNLDQIKLVNDKASLPASFGFDQMGLKVTASSVNKKQNTMSTLYANPAALQNAIKGSKELVPGGVLALITWKRQTDDHWFGANIPGELQSLEFVNTTSKTANYKLFKGKALTSTVDSTGRQKRINLILSMKPSIMP